MLILFQSENSRGSCRYSPDLIKQGIECVSCLACAKCLLYHCHYEEENFTGIQSQTVRIIGSHTNANNIGKSANECKKNIP